MSGLNKTILQQANAAVSAGDNEGFVSFCADDIIWSTVGGETLHGKEAVRAWMAKEYVEPPEFNAQTMIADGDYLAVLGEITTKDDSGKPVPNACCRSRSPVVQSLASFGSRPNHGCTPSS